ncbi:MAG: urease accessory UreF family protein [Pseudomonadota bacterium]
MAEVREFPQPRHSDLGRERRLLRLLQLSSPTLPTGAFTYSQGLEWAVHAGWVTDYPSFADWLSGIVDSAMVSLELPILRRLYDACKSGDHVALKQWSDVLYASRETAELRAEELNRARALTTLIRDLGVRGASQWEATMRSCHLAPFACAAVDWDIAIEDCAIGYAWGWLENQTAAGVKLIPLGQTDGQRVQLHLADALAQAVQRSRDVDNDAIGASAPIAAFSSVAHETLYSRLFRS